MLWLAYHSNVTPESIMIGGLAPRVVLLEWMESWKVSSCGKGHWKIIVEDHIGEIVAF